MSTLGEWLTVQTNTGPSLGPEPPVVVCVGGTKQAARYPGGFHESGLPVMMFGQSVAPIAGDDAIGTVMPPPIDQVPEVDNPVDNNVDSPVHKSGPCRLDRLHGHAKFSAGRRRILAGRQAFHVKLSGLLVASEVATPARSQNAKTATIRLIPGAIRASFRHATTSFFQPQLEG